MTGRLYTTQFIIPAATPINVPFSQPQLLDDAQLDQVDITIPPGHAGLTGFRILWSTGQIIPYVTGTWVTGDDEEIHVKYGSEITQSGLVLVGYNTDVFTHSFLLRWHVSDLTSASPVVIASPQAAPNGALNDASAITGLSGIVTVSDTLAAAS
jgi:hypothetical protein